MVQLLQQPSQNLFLQWKPNLIIYGAMIFILTYSLVSFFCWTFSLVSVPGYREAKLFQLAQHRISTIIVGTLLCIIISLLICPIWAGQELYMLLEHSQQWCYIGIMIFFSSQSQKIMMRQWLAVLDLAPQLQCTFIFRCVL